MALTMKVELSDSDIKNAIKLYLTEHNIDTEGKETHVEITAGRKGTGCRASVSISGTGVDNPSEDAPEVEEVVEDVSTAPSESPQQAEEVEEDLGSFVFDTPNNAPAS